MDGNWSHAEVLRPCRLDVPRGGTRGMDGAGDGAREAGGRGMADFEKPGGVGIRSLTCRKREDEVTVEGSVGRHHGAGDAVMGGDGEPVAPGLVEGGVGGDHCDGRGGAGLEFCAQRPCGPPGGQPANSAFSSNGAAQNAGPSPRITSPTGLAATRAPTVAPDGRTAEAEPRPPFSVAVVAPVPAPSEPIAKISAAASKAARPRAG